MKPEGGGPCLGAPFDPGGGPARREPLQTRLPLHGRRRGRKLGPRRAALLAAALPDLALDPSKLLFGPERLFPGTVTEVWLEIGFGGGEHLAAEAAAHPGIGYIGCDIFLNGIAKALALAETRQLRNLRLFNCDGRDLLAALPPASLAGVYLLYPDPWPKRRHQNRRFLSAEMLARLAKVLRPRGELRFATDADHLAAWTLAQVLKSSCFEWAPPSAGAWQRPWDGWTGTRYETKALREGRKPVYLTFYRK
ncbi:MAG TPA: tRNA (guanosine(46)-N7)-methyltransferase TrmB [Methylocella sp.]|nr:tRNA (guanosine(46)-N7)-methyltransferase TrmB [Methylocella sp.]